MEFSKLIKESGCEYADIRIANSDTELINIEDSSVSSLQKKNNFSYGIRVFEKGAWGFVYGNDLKDIKKSLEKAKKIAKLSSKKIKKRFSFDSFKAIKDNFKPKVKKEMMGVDIETKVKELFDFDYFLSMDEIRHKNVSGAFNFIKKEFYNSEGSEITESRSAFKLRLMAVGSKNNNIFRSFNRIGKTGGFETFEKINKEDFAKELYDKFMRSMVAKQAPAGKFPLVIDNVLSEVFFHEAVGHACEADHHLEKITVLEGKLGKEIAPDNITLIDTAKMEEEFGYYKYDDEGLPGESTVLIDKGILSNLLHSRETAIKMGLKPTGNGRAENPTFMPLPRMSNTYLKPGKHSFEELFHGIKQGIYAKGSSGGVVDPNNGNFMFNAEEAFLIENGQITTPLVDVSLAGNILDTLKKIKKVGKDSKPTKFGGECGKRGQYVPVGGKAPGIMLSEAMIGGQS